MLTLCDLFLFTTEERMIRFIAVIFALAVATSAQAMSHTRAASSAGWHATVHQACGAGMHYLNGRCVTTATRRNVRRCAVWGAVEHDLALNALADLPDPASAVGMLAAKAAKLVAAR